MKKFGEQRKWHLKYAKFNRHFHQSLLDHCLNVGSLSVSLLNYLERINHVKVTDKVCIQMFLTGFLHDAGKASVTFQDAVEDFLKGEDTEPLNFANQQKKDILPIMDQTMNTIESKFQLAIDFSALREEIIWSITQLGRRENAGAVSYSFERAPSKDALICKEIAHLADVMMSQHTVDDVASIKIEGEVLSRLCLTYSKVSVVRGLLTQFLHIALEEQFTARGFEPVQWFPNGTVYLGSADKSPPLIDEAALVESLVNKMRDTFDRKRPSQMARAAFGSLTAQVIAAPEFLFASDEIIHEFWQFVAHQNFADQTKVKAINDLKETEMNLLNLISQGKQGNDQIKNLALLARFIADYNLLIVLYQARSQLIEKAKDAKLDSKMIEEATKKVQEGLAQVLNIPLESMSSWPKIALQTGIKERFPVAVALWLSPYFENANEWRKQFLKALEKSTLELARIWRRVIPEKYRIVASLLSSDVTAPLNPKIILNEVEKLNLVIKKGKDGHGTPTCQKCGGVATIEAQAKLFGGSEIYHDLLVAGQKVGGGNKIRVCELCEFEVKLRSLFVGRGDEAFLIFPQLALSRTQQRDWQNTADQIKYNTGKLPPLLRVNRWAELLIKGDFPSLSSPGSSSGFSEKELASVIQNLPDTEALGEDLSSLIEPPLDAKDGNDVAALIHQGKCKLKERYEKQVFEALNRLEPVYLSPNFIMLLTAGTLAGKDEPESSAKIKWVFFQCILSRLFSAAVLPSDSSVAEERATLGYTTIPADIILRPLAEKLNTSNGWITISELETDMIRLSGLILTAKELSSAKADYGNSTLLRLLDKEPGRILVRMNSNKKGQASLKNLIRFLDAWNYGKCNELEGVKNA